MDLDRNTGIAAEAQFAGGHRDRTAEHPLGTLGRNLGLGHHPHPFRLAPDVGIDHFDPRWQHGRGQGSRPGMTAAEGFGPFVHLTLMAGGPGGLDRIEIGGHGDELPFRLGQHRLDPFPILARGLLAHALGLVPDLGPGHGFVSEPPLEFLQVRIDRVRSRLRRRRRWRRRRDRHRGRAELSGQFRGPGHGLDLIGGPQGVFIPEEGLGLALELLQGAQLRRRDWRWPRWRPVRGRRGSCAPAASTTTHVTANSARRITTIRRRSRAFRKPLRLRAVPAITIRSWL